MVDVTVRGVVASVSASARVVMLAQPVNGFSTLAIAANTDIARANGARASLADVAPGATVEATGRPSTSGTVVVRRLVLA